MSVPQIAPSPADRRRHPRELTLEQVKLVTPSGHAYAATLVDRSLSGLRVEVEDVADLPRDLKVLSPHLSVIHFARLVWRAAPYAGLSILRTMDMRTAAGPNAAEMQKLWRTHISR